MNTEQPSRNQIVLDFLVSSRLCGEFGETQFITDTKKRSLAGSNLLPAVGNVARRGEVAALAGQRVPCGGYYLDAHGARRSSDPHVDESPSGKTTLTAPAPTGMLPVIRSEP